MINENTLQLTVSFSRLGTRRAVPKSKAQVEVLDAGQVNVAERPEQDVVHVAKSILDSPELKAIASLDHSVRAYLSTRAVPAPMLKSGVFMVHADLVESIYTYLEEMKTRRDSLVEQFIDAYPKLIEAARDALKGLFDARQYPSSATVRNAFSMEWSLREQQVSGKLKTISKAIYDKEVEKAKGEVASMVQSVKDALAVSLSGMVNHLVERLSGEEDGKPKIFKGSTVENLTEFLDLYYKRTPDSENDTLAPLVEQAKKVLSGVDVKSIKSDTTIRERVAQGFAEIKSALDAMPAVSRPERAVTLADEEV